MDEILRELGNRLSVAEEALQAGLVKAQAGIWEWTLATDRLYWDHHMFSIYGVDPQDFIGDYGSFNSCVHPDDRKRVRDAVNLSVETGVPFEHLFRVKRGDGQWGWIIGKGGVVRDEAGVVIKLAGINFSVSTALFDCIPKS